MPKRVDHDQRRREIVAAVWRIAADRGLEAVSLSEVAAEAGISKGLVQHYFPGKDEMLRHAMAALREHVDQRVPAAEGSRLDQLRDLLAALLPIGDDARERALVVNAFLIRALKDPELAAVFRTGNDLILDALTTRINALARTLDERAEAEVLLAVVTGLGDAILLGRHTPESALAVLDHQLQRLSSP